MQQCSLRARQGCSTHHSKPKSFDKVSRKCMYHALAPSLWPGRFFLTPYLLFRSVTAIGLTWSTIRKASFMSTVPSTGCLGCIWLSQEGSSEILWRYNIGSRFKMWVLVAGEYVSFLFSQKENSLATRRDLLSHFFVVVPSSQMKSFTHQSLTNLVVSCSSSSKSSAWTSSITFISHNLTSSTWSAIRSISWLGSSGFWSSGLSDQSSLGRLDYAYETKNN